MGLNRENREQQTEWDLHESTEIIPLDFTEENAVNITGVENTVQENALKGLMVFLAERDLLDKEFEILSKQEVTPENIHKFKELRLKYVKNRTQGTNKWHEKESEVSLRYKQFLDAKKRSENAINESRETVLMNGEKFYENQEKEKARLLNLERIEKVKPYVEDVTGLDFSAMSDYDFDDYVLGKKTRFENEAKERKEKEEAELVENRKNETLQKRQIEIAPYLQFHSDPIDLKEMPERLYQDMLFNCKKAKTEFDLKVKKQEEENAKLKIEADKQAKIQAEKDAEIKRLNDEKIKAENERIAKEKAKKLEADNLAKAPIKKQLSVWVESFDIPKTEVDNEISKDIIAKFEAFKKWSLTQVNNL
jgi:colicin import membrane protein